MTGATPTRVDLHCHTSRSDGVHEPDLLHGMLVEAGMRVVAITDHDTLDGVRELRAAGHLDADARPRIVAGVEINTTADPDLAGADGLDRKARELHIIGLGIDLDDERLESTLADQRRRRIERRDAILDRLEALGKDVRDHLPPDAPIRSAGRPHIAAALVAAGHAADVDDAFRRYLSIDGPAYVPRPGIGPRTAIDRIRAAGGVAVLAHRSDALDHPRLLGALIEAGLDGIEVYHSSFGPDDFARMGALADAHDLFASGGTDYHGHDAMTYPEALARTQVPDAVGARLLERLDR